MAEVYGTIRGSGKVVKQGRGEVIVELGLSTDGIGDVGAPAPLKDDYYLAETGVIAHVCMRAEVVPKFHGPFFGHISVFESIDAAT